MNIQICNKGVTKIWKYILQNKYSLENFNNVKQHSIEIKQNNIIRKTSKESI